LAVALGRSKGDHTKSTSLLNEALAIDPAYAEAHRALGVLAQINGDQDDAARQYRVAIAVDPTLAEPRMDLGLLLINRGEEKAGIAEMLSAMLPPCDNPERALAREYAMLGTHQVEPAWETAVRAQAAAHNQLDVLTLLNNRKRADQAAVPSLKDLNSLLDQKPPS
jgi:Flp pilus assembly protein TadD